MTDRRTTMQQDMIVILDLGSHENTMVARCRQGTGRLQRNQGS